MKQPVVFFDDYCVLCSWSVRFIHRNDPHRRFWFSAVDSEAFRQIAHLLPADIASASGAGAHRKSSGNNAGSAGSVILYDNGKVFLRSAAALRIAARLRFPLPLLTGLMVIPRALRDAVYDLVARNRYRWFGRRETCYLPSGSLRNRFLD